MTIDDLVHLEVCVLGVKRGMVTVEYFGEVHKLPERLVESHTDLSLCAETEIVEIEIPEWLAFEKGLV